MDGVIEPYYSEDGITLYCARAEDVLPLIESESIDLTVTSPPYDNLRMYNGFKWDFEMIARELYRVTKSGGVCVWIVGDQMIDGSETLTSAKQKIFFREKCGWNIHDTMSYVKEHPIPQSDNRYWQQWETMFILSKGKPQVFNPIKKQSKNAGVILKSRTFRNTDGKTKRAAGRIAETKTIGNVWVYDVGYMKTTMDKEAFEHPAMFPEQLAKDHILSWSNEGDIVHDCFVGSGTTLKGAKCLGRKAIGIEISEKYCEIAVNRLRQKELFGIDLK